MHQSGPTFFSCKVKDSWAVIILQVLPVDDLYYFLFRNILVERGSELWYEQVMVVGILFIFLDCDFS